MANTAKPYFGDVGDMTYLQWLQRYVELTIGDGDSTADTASPGSPWLADTWRDRFADMLKRAEARLHPQDSGPIDTLFNDEALLDNPEAAIAALLARYPEAEKLKLHPADVPFFITLCKTLGKPVNFVPVIDKDVRRWWRSDSLWQAHDARYTADQVCIIPGTQSVAGITRVDEPVGELLDRFEQASIDDVAATDGQPDAGGLPPPGPRRRHRSARGRARLARRVVGRPHRHQPGAPHRCAGRVAGQRKPQRHTPVHGCAPRAERRWRGHAERPAVATSGSTSGSRCRRAPSTAACRWSPSRMRRPRCGPCWPSRPASTAPTPCPRCTTTPPRSPSDWDPEEVADHTGVTATFGAPLAPGLALVPDALVGHCWPAVFSVIGVGGHRGRLPGCRGPAEPGAPGSRRSSAQPDAEDSRPN